LTCANACDLAGEAAACTRAIERARDWIDRVALPNVPTVFRSSFLERNPINREVLTWHARVPRVTRR
jgi:hypothetical protein